MADYISKITDRELHRIAITAIIYREDKRFLITRRSPTKKVFPGKWMVPGGGLNVDDYIHTAPSFGEQWYHTLEKALKREIKEEVNLEVGKPLHLVDLTFIRPDGIPVLVLSYYCPLLSGNVKLDQDATEFTWVTADEAKEYDLLPGLMEEFKMVSDILMTK